MRSEAFERRVIAVHGEASTRVAASSAQVEAYRGVLPDFLLELWEQEGFSGYGEGSLSSPRIRSWLIRRRFGFR